MKLNNVETFNQAPTVSIPRSAFTMPPFQYRTTFNVGRLIPFFVQEIYPGDTMRMRGSIVLRTQTPIYPTMDELIADIRFFFVPMRLTWEHWKEFNGENTTGTWAQTTEYTIPQLVFGQTGTAVTVNKGSLLNYMGVRLGLAATSNGYSINALPVRGYQLIWNDWYRDENFAAPVNINKGDSTSYLTDNAANATWGTYNNTNTWVATECAPVYKFKDYYNACLPEPQKGDPVTLPIGETAPLVFNGLGADTASRLHDTRDNSFIGGDGNLGYNQTSQPAGTLVPAGFPTVPLALDVSNSHMVDLSNAVAATINAQRLAFATQRILEQSARTGTRYFEIINGFWHVYGQLSARFQRPEYLGGKRLPLSQTQVAQTSATDSTSPQGNTAAFSLTTDVDQYYHKSFEEHGYILGLICVRYQHTYDQGLNRLWSRRRKLDFYWPQLAFLGEQAVLNKEIMFTGTATDEETFGFNERWSELRYMPSMNTSEMSTQFAQSLDAWHYGDDYGNTVPVLSEQWRRENPANVDRTLAVTSAVADQLLMDSCWTIDAVRPLPLHSIPGLLDHF